MKFAVFISGNGSNLQAIIDAVSEGYLSGEIALVVSNKADAYGLTRAEKANIPALCIDPKAFTSKEIYEQAIVEELKFRQVDFIVLAGYMKILSPYFIQVYRDKILNIHPSLLPSFKGAHAISDAFDYGVKVTGVTVHFVDEEMDHGAIIAQQIVEIKEDESLDDLEEKVHKVEHSLYPKIIQKFIQGQINIKGRKVYFDSSVS